MGKIKRLVTAAVILFSTSVVFGGLDKAVESDTPWLKACVNRGAWDLAVKHGDFLYSVKVYHLGNRFRMEIPDPSGKSGQVFIYDDNSLYRLDYASGRAYCFSMQGGAFNALFAGIFPQEAGLSRQNRKVLGKENIGGRECLLETYENLMEEKNGPTWVSVKEWIDTATGAMIRVSSAAPEAFDTTVSNIGWRLFMEGKSFQVPRGFTVINMEISPAGNSDAAEKTINVTIPPGKKK
jgi:hypothetical protein